MARDRTDTLHVTADSLYPGTTVRYHYRAGNSLATVVRRSERYISFLGEECNGTFTYEQIELLLEEGRLQIVLDDETHVPVDGISERL